MNKEELHLLIKEQWENTEKFYESKIKPIRVKFTNGDPQTFEDHEAVASYLSEMIKLQKLFNEMKIYCDFCEKDPGSRGSSYWPKNLF